MSLFNIVKDRIFKNKEIRESGKFVGIPFPFPRLAEYIPVIEKAHFTGILAATGCGKSRYARFVYVYHVYKFHKETGYPVKIIYLPIEDNKEKVYMNMLCHYLHELYGIYINLQELSSKGNRILPDFVAEKLDEAKAFFAEFEKVVTVVDGMSEPTEIYNYCKEYAERTGKTEEYELELEGEVKIQKRYVADNDTHTIVLIDNSFNIDSEKATKDEREAVILLCKKYIRGGLCNFYQFSVILILQQDFATERQSFTKDGDSIIAKLKPSLAAIGDVKTISRSMHQVFGIFHPARYKLLNYPSPPKDSPLATYRLDILGNRFRSLSVLKANDTDFGQEVAFNFDAVTENMTELPPIGSMELQQIYDKIQAKGDGRFSKMKTTFVEPIEETGDSSDLPF